MNNGGYMASPNTGIFGTCNGVEFPGQFVTLRFFPAHQVINQSSGVARIGGALQGDADHELRRRWQVIARGLECLKQFASEQNLRGQIEGCAVRANEAGSQDHFAPGGQVDFFRAVKECRFPRRHVVSPEIRESSTVASA